MIIILAILTTLLSAKEPVDYKISAGMKGLYFNSVTNKVNSVGFFMEGELTYTLMPNLTTFFKGGVNLAGGSSDSVFVKDYAPKSSFFYKDAILKFDPLAKLVVLEAGLIHQGRYNAPLLMTGTFPSAIESFEYKTGQFTARLSLQQSIASSQSYTNRIDEAKEGTPIFLYEEIFAEYGKDLSSKVDASIAHFKFQDLSREVANQSRFRGNYVLGTSDSARFVYGFEGFHTNVRFQHYILPWWGPEIGVSYLFNDKAPDGSNEGYIISFENHFHIKDDVLTIDLDIFRRESDSSVTWYNSLGYGDNDTKGFMIKTTYKFNKSKMELKAFYTKTQIINNLSGYQSDGDKVGLELKKEF